MNTQYEQIIAKFQALSTQQMLGASLEAREMAFVQFVQHNFVPSRDNTQRVEQAFRMMP